MTKYDYTSKPQQVRAIQYSGDNMQEVVRFASDYSFRYEDEALSLDSGTLDGSYVLDPGDWIVLDTANTLERVCGEVEFLARYKPLVEELPATSEEKPLGYTPPDM